MAKYYNEKAKKSMDKWMEKNREQYNAYKLPINLEYYKNNSEMIREKRIKRYYFQKESQRLMNILL